MKNKILKLLILSFTTFMLVTFITVKIDAGIDKEYQTCARIDELIKKRKSQYDSAVSGGSSNTSQYYKLYQEAKKWKEDNCGGCTITAKPFSDENLNIPLNESGYIIHKYSYNGESVFCIDPDTPYNPCATYHQGGNDLGDDLKVRIAKIVKAANNLGSPGNTDIYIGTQLYIWDILGLYRTVNGIDKAALKSQIDSEVSKLESTYKPNISGLYTVVFKQDYITTDTANVLDRGAYSISQTTPGFLKSDRNGNDIIVNINTIYPKIKTLDLNPSNGGINSYQGVTFTSSNSQRLFGFNSPLNDIYLNANISFKLDTGNLLIQKVDEFNNPNYPNVEYKIYFANKQSDGSYLKGDEILQEDGSAWITNDEGQIIINETLPVGKYIINEVKVTNPLTLEPSDHLIEIRSNETTSFTQTNELRELKYHLYKVDKDDNQKLDGAEFAIYDISDNLDTTIFNDYPINKLYVSNIKTIENLNDYFKTDNLSFKIINKSNTLNNNPNLEVVKDKVAKLENGIKLTIEKLGVIKLKDNHNNEYVIYATNNLNQTKDSRLIFKGISGKKYIQIVDDLKHDLYKPNTEVNLFSDNALTTKIETLTSNDLGIIEITEDLFKKHNITSIYYQDHKQRTQEINNIFNEGYLEIPHLLYGRDYLACELSLNENYTNAKDICVKLNTRLAENISEDSFTFINKKATGDLTLTKLDEWENLKGSGVEFEIYKSALNNEDIAYYKNFKNIKLDNNKPLIKGEPLSINGNNKIILNDTSIFEIKDQLEFGYYILKEVKVNKHFDLDEKLYLIYIKASENNKYNFINSNRDVELNILKYDLEEDYRKLNDAKFMIYDISDNLDTDEINTVYGINYKDEKNSKLEIDNELITKLEDYYDDSKPLIIDAMSLNLNTTSIKNEDEKEIEAVEYNHNYKLDTLYFIKPSKKVNLYDFLIKDAPYFNQVDGLPIKYELKGKKTTISANGDLISLEPTVIEVKIVGGNYRLYSNIEDAIVYQNSLFNPYENLNFYKDEQGLEKIDIKQLSYTNEFNSNVIGDYEITYELITKDNTLYNFNRNIKVVKDDRPIYDDILKVYKDRETNEILKDYKPKEKKESDKIKALSILNKKLPKGYEGKIFETYTIQITNNDDLFQSDTYKIKALPIQHTQTGRRYIQNINNLNHNLYLKDDRSMILYFDKELTIPFAKVKLDEMGQFEISKLKAIFKEIDEEVITESPSIEYEKTDDIEIINPKFYYISMITQNTIDINTGIITPGKEVYTVEYTDLNNELQVKLYDDKPIISHRLYYPSKTKEDLVYFIDTDEDINKGMANFKYLKHGRKYLVCETSLPEGYDYINDTCVLVDTNNYDQNQITKQIDIANKKRRLDLILYKTNTSKNIKLDGAIFDVWNTFEEGKDFNDHTNDIKVKITKDKIKLVDNLLGDSVKGSCDIYNDKQKTKELIAIDKETNKTLIYDSTLNNEGYCYQKYEPNLISRKYLGRYVTGGIYLKYESIENIDGKEIKKPITDLSVSIYSDNQAINKIATYTSDINGEIIITNLADGIYYSKIDRPLKASFNKYTIVNNETIINKPSEEDYIPLNELPDIYKQINKHYVSKGMIRLPELKYGENILFKEIKAPNGYYFDDSLMEIIPKTEYGVDYLENYRINNAIIIPNLGVKE